MDKSEKPTNVTKTESNEEDKNMTQNKDYLVVVPIDSLNPSIKTIPVFVNDDKYEIILGKQTTVNQDVYDVLKSAGYIIE
ncbi:MAG: hypothetical protein RR290_00690 [Clostridia bacterium]